MWRRCQRIRRLGGMSIGYGSYLARNARLLKTLSLDEESVGSAVITAGNSRVVRKPRIALLFFLCCRCVKIDLNLVDIQVRSHKVEVTRSIQQNIISWPAVPP